MPLLLASALMVPAVCDALTMSTDQFNTFADVAAYNSANVTPCLGMPNVDGDNLIRTSAKLRRRVIARAAALGYDEAHVARIFDAKEKASTLLVGDGKVTYSHLASLSDAGIVKEVRDQERTCARLPRDLSDSLDAFR